LYFAALWTIIVFAKFVVAGSGEIYYRNYNYEINCIEFVWQLNDENGM
jgi:hypothetical protein